MRCVVYKAITVFFFCSLFGCGDSNENSQSPVQGELQSSSSESGGGNSTDYISSESLSQAYSSSSAIIDSTNPYLGSSSTLAVGSSSGNALESSSSAVSLFSSSTIAESSSSSEYASSSSSIEPMVSSSSEISSNENFVEDHADICGSITVASTGSLTAISKLPDPFTKLDKTKVSSKSDWTCRREEILKMFKTYEFGEKPKPESVSSTYSNGNLTITVKDGGKTMSFSVKITKPSGTGPFPAIIYYDMDCLGTALAGLNVASITFTTGNLAVDGQTRGSGSFYTLYGSNHSAGELTAWAYGVSRIIDAIEADPSIGIDAKHIGVTGCSRYGKGALTAGAFDERIALTIVQESGSGGASSWRLIQAQKNAGQNIQTLGSAAGEASWFTSSFSSFQYSTDKLPIDHHELEGLVAPRGLLVLENDIDWLGPEASYGTSIATKEIFDALGATESYTYSKVGGHTHCTLPTTQYHWVKSYVQKFLLEGTGETAKIECTQNANFNKSTWIDWSTPDLNF